VTVMVTAVRELFGNPIGPVDKQTRPLDHPVLAAALGCAVILGLGVVAALRRYRARTAD